MKILILANDAVGLYRFRRDLISRLLESHKVYISLPYGAPVDALKEMGCRFIDTPVDRRGLNPAKDIKLFLDYNRMIRKLRPDLVITYTIKPNIYGGMACRAAKTALAVNITGLGTAFEHKGFLQNMVTIMYRTALKRARVVFVENSSIKDILIEKKIIDGERIRLLNGAGVNLQEFPYAAYPENEVFSFLFVGRVMKEKGIEELLSAARRLNLEGLRCLLHIVGYAEEDYHEELQKASEEGWLLDHGMQERVLPFIKAADCFVLPSWHEGMANTNLESASVGRPVITTDIPGCREAVIDGVSGLLCEKRNEDSLYEAMKRIYLMPRKEREQMGIAGRRHMEDVFDKRKVVEHTISGLF